MLEIDVRPAKAVDATAIADLLDATWPDNTANRERIARLLATGGDRLTLVATSADAVVGLVDAFVTESAYAVRRWEVDLLAVAAAYRGQGIARELIRHSLNTGRETNAALSRALIHVDNVASERAFAAAGFTPQDTIHKLVVGSEPCAGEVAPPAASLIPVETLTYGGVWLEGDHAPESFRAARAERTRRDLDLAGAVIPPDALQNALDSGFTLVGDYRWWLFAY